MSKPISNSFFIPNALVDDYLQSMTGAEVKCYLFVVRKTLGWHKGTDAISISQFVEKTGLSNRSVIDACNSLVAQGLFKQTSGARNVKIFSIDLDDSATSEKSSHVKKVHVTSEKSSQVTSEKSSHTKDTIKNTTKKTKESAPTFNPLEAVLALGCSAQIANDWLAVRKAKRVPLTATALNSILKSAQSVGITPAQAIEICTIKSWVGFNAAWNWQDAGIAGIVPNQPAFKPAFGQVATRAEPVAPQMPNAQPAPQPKTTNAKADAAAFLASMGK
jgi:hypothetical protein